ncbi:MAG: HAMP domain-containing histidine kinase [Cyanobacteria bacterium]|nr:HAMP domain-containing histidine kinase [Cyanobacteriota bacterium]
MNRSGVFLRTRWRLAALSTGVMGSLSILGAVGLYHWEGHMRWQGIHRELESVAGTLHDSLEVKLTEPDRLSPSALQSLPGLCVIATAPQTSGFTCAEMPPPRHVLGVLNREGYYARLLDRAGQPLALLGDRPGGHTHPDQQWHDEVANGQRYHRLSIPLKTQAGLFWGYLQVGRSLGDLEANLALLRWLLALALPPWIAAIAAASWLLSGRAMAPLYGAYRLVQQFTGDAAHELRTPIAALRATVEAAGDRGDAHALLPVIDRQTQRLASLVDDLLWLARAESDPTSPQDLAAPCCLNDLVADALEEFAAMAIAAQVTLSAPPETLSPTAEVTIPGHEAQLYRLLANLTANAIAHTPPGGQVTLQILRRDRAVLLQVIDTGDGIDAADLPHIFERFYRVGGDRSRQGGGAGLGLAIAQAIVQRHGGTLTVTSQRHRGSTFTATFRPPLNGTTQAAIAPPPPLISVSDSPPS